MSRRVALKLALFYGLTLVGGTAVYVALFHTSLFSAMAVYFYRGLALLIVTTAVVFGALTLVRRSRWGTGITIRDVLLAVALLGGFQSVFFTHFPVTADRSISVFMLAYMDAADGSLTSDEIADRVVTEYIRERGAIDKRLEEQVVSGNIARVGDAYRITDQGRGLMRFYRVIAALFGVDPANLSP